MAVQRYIPDSVTFSSAMDRDTPLKPPLSNLMKIFIFDLFVGHVDRHAGNIVVEGRSPHRAWAIDNENIFGSNYRIASISSVARGNTLTRHVANRTIPASIKRKLADITWADFRTAAAGIPLIALKRAWLRREVILGWDKIPGLDEMQGDWGAESGTDDEINAAFAELHQKEGLS